MDNDKGDHQIIFTEQVPSMVEEDNEILFVDNNNSLSKSYSQIKEESEVSRKDKSFKNKEEEQEQFLKENIIIEFPQFFQQNNLSDLSIIQLYQYYHKLKRYYYSLISFSALKGENLITLQKNNELFKNIFSQLSTIISNIKNHLNTNSNNQNNEENQAYFTKAIQLISNIILINKKITKYEKKLKEFKDSPHTINKLFLNENKNKSKSGNRLLELTNEFDMFVQKYSVLIDKVEKNKKTILAYDEKINQLNGMIESLTIIAEKNYNLILGNEDNKNLKDKEKLSILRRGLINQYGDNYHKENFLKNIIKTKENEISSQKRKISEYNNQISNFKKEVKLMKDELQGIYTSIHESLKEEELI